MKNAAETHQDALSVRARRSVLYLPASNARAIEKAKTLDCDALILDLEDSVAPESKQQARDQAVAAVNSRGFGNKEVIVRVNGRDTEWCEQDLQAFSTAAVDAILLPKVNGADDVVTYQKYFAASTGIRLWAMIETAKSILHLEEIAAAAAHTRLACFVIGTNDLIRELGSSSDPQRSGLVGLLSLSVVAARAYGLSILDGVCNQLDDDAVFEFQCRQGRELGFDGKTLIHPRQIERCNAVFTPDADAIEWAQLVVDAFDQPANATKGAIRLDGKLVERLHLQQAQRTLALARATRR
jgi:citrate lyase subunit beta / citryl-CoA lyase